MATESSDSAANPTSEGLGATRTAPEWWDPGTYEVHVGLGDANSLKAKLTSEAAESPST